MVEHECMWMDNEITSLLKVWSEGEHPSTASRCSLQRGGL